MDYNGISVAATGEVSEEITTAEQRIEVLEAGREFAKAAGNEHGRTDIPCLFITGQFADYPDQEAHLLFENRVKQSYIKVFGYPPGSDEAKEPVSNVLLDTRGGMLDSAFRIALFLSRYASELNVYVPRRAKSAGTLVALGASRIYLSPFGELGPLDTQIPDPRNPTTQISALDCYQSVDYVRKFGFSTTTEGLAALVRQAGDQIRLPELLHTASTIASGAIKPMLEPVTALDFGGWGRSLKIGEKYAGILLRANNPDEARADRIAQELVYGYTHHLFPIDYNEALRLGLDAAIMRSETYGRALGVLDRCQEKAFVGFISEAEAEREGAAGEPRQAGVPEEAASPISRSAADRATRSKQRLRAPDREPAVASTNPSDYNDYRRR